MLSLIKQIPIVCLTGTVRQSCGGVGAMEVVTPQAGMLIETISLFVDAIVGSGLRDKGLEEKVWSIEIEEFYVLYATCRD
jgi:hypothetical protein